MRKIFNYTALVLCFFLVFSCKLKPAPIVDNSEYVYKIVDFDKYINSASNLKSNSIPGNESFIIVKAGDNLYNIAKDNNTNVKEIIKRNSLSAPFILPVGRKIFIPLPEFHIVKKGENLGKISKMYHLKTSQIINNNNLREPFNIFAGQKLAIKKKHRVVFKKSKPHIRARKIDKVYSKKIEKSNFSWPIKGELLSSFGPKKGGLYNDGINISAAIGSSVKSSQKGVVAYVGNELKGYGNLIIIKHPNKMITAYGHLDKTLVKRGEKVNKLQVIAKAGNSGNVGSPQLYFGLRRGKDPVNPQKYLKN